MFTTPAWGEFTPYSMLKLSYEARIPCRVVPPEVALHAATLPRSDELFYGPAPEPEFADDAVARAIEQRNEAITRYFEFADAHDRWRSTFKPNWVVRFIESTVSTPPASVAAIDEVKRKVRGVRNVVVARIWNWTLTGRGHKHDDTISQIP